MGSYPGTRGQGERKRVQEKTQTLRVRMGRCVCQDACASAGLLGPRTLGSGLLGLGLQFASAPSLWTVRTQAHPERDCSLPSVTRPPLKGHLPPRGPSILSVLSVVGEACGRAPQGFLALARCFYRIVTSALACLR